MSNENLDQQRRNIQEFLQLLPITLAIAGLPDAQPGSHFTDGQMEVRCNTLRNAYKHARQLVREIANR